ncbi:Tetratricopeptide repeat-containing protein [Paenibacillus sophorae]|uniref:Diadenylate cyclase n=1 Tax=Paenibacillus sophorae TaxID=1333845 RepID=A0A1H8M5N8_9BACL|nr:diadenylate cyclase [Paenibacillus sophorae]QWU17676.1 diadenylate cyclase [Paenibacillus sophorae]SEO12498.1 Tetratricopeptide repeat-containing protein [Paenibacillus sophorae]
MNLSEESLNTINESVYKCLDECLKKLNKRIHLKLFSLVYEKGGFTSQTRVKKTVAVQENAYPIAPQTLPRWEDLGKELRVPLPAAENALTPKELKSYFDKKLYREEQGIEYEKAADLETDGDSEATVSTEDETRILYSNHLHFSIHGSPVVISYILEIWNVDPVSRKMFYDKPEYSYLRMLLDFFHLDYFSVNEGLEIILDHSGQPVSKYNENMVLFNRRMTRLFLGKMQEHLLNGSEQERSGQIYDNTPSNTYYIHNLLEHMDEISSLTYENANPFGSILLMHRTTIVHSNFIRFSIRFKECDRIALDDSKRIRKLLELTNEDKDLYLIADHSHIYGLGEANWNLLKNALVLRLDFHGLSKFSLSLVCTEDERSTSGTMVVKDDRKYYSYDLALAENQLLAVSAKNPRLGEEGYSPERFINLLQKVFWDGIVNETVERSCKILDLMVRKAREQKHGTMVVITDPKTAVSELAILRKQSTLIEPRPIKAEHIPYLTSIDGAIYFDTNGDCHAIGVILDGIAKPEIGDASRGARFNSAHRYLHKLKGNGTEEDEKKCVIAIISEDGMVDLLPEIENEEQLLAISYEIINLIKENADTGLLEEKENILLNSAIADSEWLFQIGKAYRNSKKYERALVFLEQALKQAKDEFISSYHYNLVGLCYYLVQKDNTYLEKALQLSEKALHNPDSEDRLHTYYGNVGIACGTLAAHYSKEKQKDRNKIVPLYNKAVHALTEAVEIRKRKSIKIEDYFYVNRAICYRELGKMEDDKSNQAALFHKALEDFSFANSINPDRENYWNQALIHIVLGEHKEAASCLIHAIAIQTDPKYWDKLHALFEKEPALVMDAAALYKKLTGQEELPQELKQPYETYLNHLEMTERESAAGKQLDQNPEDSDSE